MRYTYDYYSGMEDAIFMVLGIFVIVMLVILVFALVAYIFRSIGLYKMAKNTGMENPWLAWVPVGCNYLVGRLADRYNGTQGKQTKYSILLLIFGLISTFGSSFIYADNFSAIIEEIAGYGYYYGHTSSGFFVLMSLILSGCSIANLVFYLLAHNSMYKDFEPSNATLYTVLCFFGLDCICNFLVRNNVPVGVAGKVYPKQPKYNQSGGFDGGGQPGAPYNAQWNSGVNNPQPPNGSPWGTSPQQPGPNPGGWNSAQNPGPQPPNGNPWGAPPRPGSQNPGPQQGPGWNGSNQTPYNSGWAPQQPQSPAPPPQTPPQPEQPAPPAGTTPGSDPWSSHPWEKNPWGDDPFKLNDRPKPEESSPFVSNSRPPEAPDVPDPDDGKPQGPSL